MGAVSIVLAIVGIAGLVTVMNGIIFGWWGCSKKYEQESIYVPVLWRVVLDLAHSEQVLHRKAEHLNIGNNHGAQSRIVSYTYTSTQCFQVLPASQICVSVIIQPASKHNRNTKHDVWTNKTQKDGECVWGKQQTRQGNKEHSNMLFSESGWLIRNFLWTLKDDGQETVSYTFI